MLVVPSKSIRSLVVAAFRALLLVAICLGCASRPSQSAEPPGYGLEYHARFQPADGQVAVRVVARQTTPRLTLVDLNAPTQRYRDASGDGAISRDGDRLIWQVPDGGGELRYTVVVDHRRRGDGYDAKLSANWAVLRLDDLFPPARVRSRAGAQARTRLFLTGPEGWSFETPYGPVGPEGIELDDQDRRHDRPAGWLAAGDLGIRRTRIDDRRIAIAGPKDQDLRRLDLLVFLRFTVPTLVEIVPHFPARLLIVSGSADMWRGGLSGPSSLYLHADRPMVSGNATSAVLHELMHVATLEPPAAGADWIAEGIAEYYSLVVLQRTGGISESRFQRAFADLEEWAERDRGTLADPSTGADTARAVLLFRDLDLELREADSSLDEVVGPLLSAGPSVAGLTELVTDKLGRRSAVLEAAAPTAASVGLFPRAAR